MSMVRDTMMQDKAQRNRKEHLVVLPEDRNPDFQR
jgi:hypothetical protein